MLVANTGFVSLLVPEACNMKCQNNQCASQTNSLKINLQINNGFLYFSPSALKTGYFTGVGYFN